MKTLTTNIFRSLGIDGATASHAERIVSGIGGFVAIFAVIFTSRALLGFDHPGILVASMGASAVLLFAVPHGPLSQPWNVLGGHLVSAAVGVSCARYIPNELVAASAAVGIAIGSMYYLKCIHPPGGATALSAVAGGEAVHNLGYQFVLTPVLLDVFLILAVAVLFNFLFHWRQYPAYLQKRKAGMTTSKADRPAISHEDFVYALSQIDSFIDVSEQDLLRIYDIATQRHMGEHLPVDQIVLGGIYSNGGYGGEWSVRQIVDESADGDSVIYKTIAGRESRRSGTASRLEFARWAKYRVNRDDENWKRVEPDKE